MPRILSHSRYSSSSSLSKNLEALEMRNRPQSGRAGSSRNFEESKSLLDEAPDSIICETLHIKGTLQYRNLLRIDGSFEGTLVSEGSLIIGPRGMFNGDVNGLDEVLIDGGMAKGSFACKSITLKNGARVIGDVTTKSLSLDGSCSVKGKVTVSN